MNLILFVCILAILGGFATAWLAQLAQRKSGKNAGGQTFILIFCFFVLALFVVCLFTENFPIFALGGISYLLSTIIGSRVFGAD